MAKHGLFLEEKDIMYGDFWETPTYEAMDAFFASGEELPDAFICCNDSMAIAVCSKLNEHGYSVPQDVIVTGFDGIEMEKYHSPRLCTAFQNNKELAKEIIDILDKLSKDKNTEPFEKQLFYTAVFSESCGCKAHDGELSNRNLISFVQHYLSRNFEEHMDGMENNVTSDPVPEKVREVLRKFCFGRSAVCMTESFLKLLGENNESSSTDNNSYPQEMTLFTSTYEDGSQPEDAKFSSNQLLPDIDRAFGEYNMIYVIPMHFQDIVIGYYTTPYCPTEHHNEMLYTYTMTLDRCLETMRSHAHMLSLNRRLGFLFTHDQLTGIYNRYGFYSNFKNEAIRSGAKKSVFIVSADLNDMKYINDTFGHSAGDTALTITAQALQGAADGDEDVICARFGGDEFVVAKICEDSAAEYGERYRKNFRNVLDKLNSESGNPFEVHVSIGVYSAELSGDESIDELIEFADKLMYTDKALHKRKPRNMPKDLAINEV
jgi:diguanylate cyclase (GGDEF)-like protein